MKMFLGFTVVLTLISTAHASQLEINKRGLAISPLGVTAAQDDFPEDEFPECLSPLRRVPVVFNVYKTVIERREKGYYFSQEHVCGKEYSISLYEARGLDRFCIEDIDQFSCEVDLNGKPTEVRGSSFVTFVDWGGRELKEFNFHMGYTDEDNQEKHQYGSANVSTEDMDLDHIILRVNNQPNSDDYADKDRFEHLSGEIEIRDQAL